MSDGIDSPVAGYMMRKQGMELIIVSFLNNRSASTRKKVERLARAVGGKLIMIDNVDTQKTIQERCSARYQCVLCKRAMYRKAQAVAREHGAEFLITGENLGQVASQTLENLTALDQAADITVLRPLIGLDKDDIIRIARKIGTYDTSISPSPPCAFVPRNPVTRADLDKVLEEERWIRQDST